MAVWRDLPRSWAALCGIAATVAIDAPQTDATVEQLISLAAPLTRSEPTRELIMARLVEPTRGVGAGVRAGLQTENLQLERTSRVINDARARLASEGVVARGVALTSNNPGDDLVHIVEREPVDLVLAEGRRPLIGEGCARLPKAGCERARRSFR